MLTLHRSFSAQNYEDMPSQVITKKIFKVLVVLVPRREAKEGSISRSKNKAVRV